jgi:hypothetical protein
MARAKTGTTNKHTLQLVTGRHWSNLFKMNDIPDSKNMPIQVPRGYVSNPIQVLSAPKFEDGAFCVQQSSSCFGRIGNGGLEHSGMNILCSEILCMGNLS